MDSRSRPEPDAVDALDYVRSIRDQCVAAGVAFHFKQWGGVVVRLRDGVAELRAVQRPGAPVGLDENLTGAVRASRGAGELPLRGLDELPCPRDHFVHPQQQRRRDGQAEGLRGLEVDDQLELRW